MAETKVTIRQVDGLTDALGGKQETLVSAVNIKTINSTSLLGTGNIDVGTGSGESNTASNLGAGEGIFAQKVGVDLQLKGLEAGSGISLTPSATGITIASTASGAGEVNTASNLGTAEGVFAAKVGADLRLKSLRAGSGMSLSSDGNEITFNATAVSGEVNTAANIGGGQGIYDSKVGAELRLRSLVAGSGIALTGSAGNPITISSTVTPGETNTGVNLGTANGVYASKTGSALNFKSLRAGTGVTMDVSSTEITINSTGAGEVNTASNLGGGNGVFGTKVGTDLRFKSLVPGTGISMSATANQITISAPTATSLWTDSGTYIYPNTQGSGVDVRQFDQGGFYAKLPTQAGVVTGYGVPSVTAYDNWNPTTSQFLIKNKRLKENYTTTHSDYRTLTWLSSHVVVHDTAAGYQQSFSTDSGGRTMTNAYEAMCIHRAYGDVNGYFATVSVMGHDNMGAISGNWTGQPTGVVIAGTVIANSAKTNVNGNEFQIYDNGFGNVTGIGAVYGLYRENTLAEYNHGWVGVRTQSNGSAFCEVGFQAANNFDIGFDATSMSSSGDDAAFVMAAGQRMYLGAPRVFWPNLRPTLSGPYLISNGTDITVAGGIIRQTGALGLVSPVTASSATGGVASALPAAPFTYIRIQLDGVNYKIPVYNN